MPLLVVRHARAGSRRRWEGPDAARPLSPRGRRQAAALVDVLGPYAPAHIVSSRSVRCVETMEPLAAHLGLDVEHSAALAEGAGAGPALALARRAGRSASTVLCTHGDVVAALLDALSRADGLALDDDAPLAKGSTWVLEAHGGRFVAARYLPPPA